MVTPIHPKAYREKVGPEEFARKPVGAGPYRIIKNEQAQEVVFERCCVPSRGEPREAAREVVAAAGVPPECARQPESAERRIPGAAEQQILQVQPARRA